MAKLSNKDKIEFLENDTESLFKRMRKAENAINHHKNLLKIMIFLWIALAFFLVYYKELFQ